LASETRRKVFILGWLFNIFVSKYWHFFFASLCLYILNWEILSCSILFVPDQMCWSNSKHGSWWRGWLHTSSSKLDNTYLHFKTIYSWKFLFPHELFNSNGKLIF
jgi:hypothetical protein